MGKQLISILKTIGVIVGFAGSVWVAAIGYSNIIGDISDVREEVAAVKSVTNDINRRVDSLYILSEQREKAIEEVKDAVNTSEGRLIYYIKHEGTMTNEQILDAFELGVEVGKKKELTVSDLLGGMPLRTENGI